jgi:uncharacterized membrane protein HdeD (DUF308 family)
MICYRPSGGERRVAATINRRAVMSGNPVVKPSAGLSYSHVRSKWGWFVALGVALVLLGVLALGDVVAVTLASAVFVGAMFLVGGIFHLIHAFMVKTWSGFLMNVLAGVLYVIGGALIMDEPIAGALLITIFLIAALVVGGALRITVALRHREMGGWWLMVLSGLVSVVIGILLYGSLPWSGLWVLGTLIGVELLVQGVTWLMFGIALRRLST